MIDIVIEKSWHIVMTFEELKIGVGILHKRANLKWRNNSRGLFEILAFRNYNYLRIIAKYGNIAIFAVYRQITHIQKQKKTERGEEWNPVVQQFQPWFFEMLRHFLIRSSLSP